MNTLSLEKDDPFHLARFVTAQSETYSGALAEIDRGRKKTHWMWWIFPQIKGLGSSDYSLRYSIKSLDEAKAYLNHPILGARLIECSDAVLASPVPTAGEIFGGIDTLKLQSSMTLFEAAFPNSDSVFLAVLEKYFQGRNDDKTLRILSEMNLK